MKVIVGERYIYDPSYHMETRYNGPGFIDSTANKDARLKNKNVEIIDIEGTYFRARFLDGPLKGDAFYFHKRCLVKKFMRVKNEPEATKKT